jgi:exopolyphosphatase / guanosine-5'-triphosphate,3'-diphosphate pyrophosphatase
MLFQLAEEIKMLKAIIQNFFLITLLTTSLSAEIERRAAIDIGSGSTKVAIANVDNETNQIIDIVLETSFPVPYQASLDKSEDGTFDKETKALGLSTFKEIKALIDQYQVERIAAIATSAFRKANNSKSFISQIRKETSIQIQIISQREEGEIAFFSALASNLADPDKAVVMDIGTGSLQITTFNAEQQPTVYMGEQMGSVAFKNYIVSVLQDNDLDETITPNPMSEEDLKNADSFARAFGRKAYPVIKKKIQESPFVVGIGRLFYHSVRPLASEGNMITRNGLRKYIESALNKTDEELNNPFAYVDVSNCILTLGMMKALHIQGISPIETTSTLGLLVSPDYWRE